MEKTKLGATEHRSRGCWVRLENQVAGPEVAITRRDPGGEGGSLEQEEKRPLHRRAD